MQFPAQPRRGERKEEREGGGNPDEGRGSRDNPDEGRGGRQ